VRGLGLAARSATLLLVAGGGLGLAGFRLGGWLADTRGRRPALLAGGSLFAVGVAGFYGATPPPGAAGLVWLGASLCALAAGGNAAVATFRAHASELLPSPLRGTFGGLLAVGAALGWSLSMWSVAALAGPVGGVGHAVSCVVLAALPAAALLLRRLPETAAPRNGPEYRPSGRLAGDSVA
jgi:MFS family permease